MPEPTATMTTNNRSKVLLLIAAMLVVVIAIIWSLTFLLPTPEEKPGVNQPPVVEATHVPAELPATGVSL